MGSNIGPPPACGTFFLLPPHIPRPGVVDAQRRSIPFMTLSSDQTIVATTDNLTMANLNLPVVVFLIVLLTQLVTWVGKTVLQELAFGIYTRLFLAGTQKSQKRIRAQVLQDKAELGKTSSQDEFSKWAKLKRKVDKGLADLEKTSACTWMNVVGADDRQLALLGPIVVRAPLLDAHLGGHDRRVLLPRVVVPPRARVLGPGRLGARACLVAPRLPWRPEG